MNEPYATLRDGKTGKVKAIYEIVAFQHPATGAWYDSRDPAEYQELPDDERIAEMVMMRRDGYTLKQIGEAYGVSYQAVQQAIKRAQRRRRVHWPIAEYAAAD